MEKRVDSDYLLEESFFEEGFWIDLWSHEVGGESIPTKERSDCLGKLFFLFTNFFFIFPVLKLQEFILVTRWVALFIFLLVFLEVEL